MYLSATEPGCGGLAVRAPSFERAETFGEGQSLIQLLFKQCIILISQTSIWGGISLFNATDMKQEFFAWIKYLFQLRNHHFLLHLHLHHLLPHLLPFTLFIFTFEFFCSSSSFKWKINSGIISCPIHSPQSHSCSPTSSSCNELEILLRHSLYLIPRMVVSRPSRLNPLT